MVTITVAHRHDTGPIDHQVFCCPHSANWRRATKECRTEFFTSDVPNHFLHVPTLRVSESLTHTLSVDVLICIHAHNQSIPLIPTDLQLLGQVVVKVTSGTIYVLLLLHKVATMLLVG